MARKRSGSKPRDAAAERARKAAYDRKREQIARDLGYDNRYQMRKAIETGKREAFQPKRVRSAKTKAAQAKFLTGSAVPTDPVLTYDQYVSRMGRRKECEDWSEVNAATTASKFEWTDSVLESNLDRLDSDRRRRTKGAKWKSKSSRTNARKRKWIEKHGLEAYIDIYYRAFVEGGERYHLQRYNGGSEAMLIWYTEIVGYQSVEEYELKYVLDI